MWQDMRVQMLFLWERMVSSRELKSEKIIVSTIWVLIINIFVFNNNMGKWRNEHDV